MPNILLIIDPQNDFIDAPYTDILTNTVLEKGKLSVPGSSNDMAKLASLINTVGDKFDQIHVSLDTHTLQHIGHPQFWKTADDKKIPNTIFMLKNENEKIMATNILQKDVEPNVGTIEVKPVNEALNEYVKEYIKFYDTPASKHGQSPFIWFEHCLEGTVGHQVSPVLKCALDKIADKVTYHIKGQNNLAEMYSIFSAEKPVTNTNLPDIYTGTKTQDGSNEKSYEKVINLKNINTERNTNLMKEILGNGNTVYICGEARTHCVKSSTIDLVEYANENGGSQNIFVIKDLSSPIPGVPDELANDGKIGNLQINLKTYEVVLKELSSVPVKIPIEQGPTNSSLTPRYRQDTVSSKARITENLQAKNAVNVTNNNKPWRGGGNKTNKNKRNRRTKKRQNKRNRRTKKQ